MTEPMVSLALEEIYCLFNLLFHYEVKPKRALHDAAKRTADKSFQLKANLWLRVVFLFLLPPSRLAESAVFPYFMIQDWFSPVRLPSYSTENFTIPEPQIPPNAVSEQHTIRWWTGFQDLTSWIVQSESYHRSSISHRGVCVSVRAWSKAEKAETTKGFTNRSAKIFSSSQV